MIVYHDSNIEKNLIREREREREREMAAYFINYKFMNSKMRVIGYALLKHIVWVMYV